MTPGEIVFWTGCVALVAGFFGYCFALAFYGVRDALRLRASTFAERDDQFELAKNNFGPPAAWPRPEC